MEKVTLSSPLRNNLLSLQQTAKLQDRTQNRLATGLKVNSAIGNPSSYYTAKALNNRVGDLSFLLDSMGRAIQTVKASKEGIESASEVLEQMRSVTEQTLTEAGFVPYAAEIEYNQEVDKLLAQGYIAVTSAMTPAEVQALLDTDGTKLVLTEDVTWNTSLSVHGKNVVLNGGGHTLSMKGIYNYGSGATYENMKIVNTQGTGSSWARTIYDAGGNITIKNLDILQENTIGWACALDLRSTGTVENINIQMSGKAEEISGIWAWNSNTIKNVSVSLSGGSDSILAAVGSFSKQVSVEKIGMKASGGKAYGIIGPVKDMETSSVGGEASRPAALYDGKANTEAILNQLGKDALAANAANQFYVGDKNGAFGQGNWYLPAIGELMEMYGINTSAMINGYGSSGVVSDNKNAINKALATLKGKGVEAEALGNKYYWSSSESSSDGSWVLGGGSGYRSNDTKNNTYGVRCFQLLENCFSPFNSSADGSGGGSGSGVAAPKIGDVMYSDKTWGSADDYVQGSGKTAVGIVVGVNADGSVKIMNLKDLTFSSNNTAGNFNPDDPYGGSVSDSRWSTGSKMYQDITGVENFGTYKLLFSQNPNAQIVSVEALNTEFAQLDAASYQQRYNDILKQYDSLISDSSYKGVNLLKSDELKVNFNENGTSSLTVVGADMSSNGIGLSLADWAEKEGIMQSVRELAEAVSALRSFSEDLGNNYSIITTRQNFTEKLINVLTEGADQLTQADMNEESANMLALQTRQQLAVNSLALASQASQSVLKLF